MIIAAIARGAQGAIDTYFPAWAEQAAKKVERIQAAKRRLEAERRRVNQITSSKLVDDLRVVSDVNDSMMRSRIAHDEGEELQDMPKEEEKVEGDKEEAKTSSEDTLDGIGVHRFSVSTSPRPAESSDKTVSLSFSLCLLSLSLSHTHTHTHTHKTHTICA